VVAVEPVATVCRLVGAAGMVATWLLLVQVETSAPAVERTW
jgi:hypothetical protein